jgi:hypothetical protein
MFEDRTVFRQTVVEVHGVSVSIARRKIRNRGLDGFWIPIIQKACRALLQNSGPLLDFPQDQPAAIRRDIATVELRHHSRELNA